MASAYSVRSASTIWRVGSTLAMPPTPCPAPQMSFQGLTRVEPKFDAPLSGCVITKIDEATNLGSALDTVLRYKLPVYYVSTGQKVPENLYVATRSFLIRTAFCVPREHSPFVPHEDDIPALLSALSVRSGTQAPEVRFG